MVFDSNSPVVTNSYLNTIGTPGSIPIYLPATLAGGTVGGPSSQTISASGGIGSGYAYQVTSGSLPPGLTLNSSTGVLSGMPDQPGSFSFTVTATDSSGDTGSQVYSLTVASPLGTSRDAVYVENLYGLLLRRAADSGGAYWVTQLDQGVSPSNLVISIESSYEYLCNLVTGIYQHSLNRTPDPGGLSHWVGVLQGGATIEQVIEGFIASPEFYQVQGGGTNAGFINVFYQDILGRQPDAAGYAYWLNGMNNGTVTPAGLAAGFLSSQEYRNDLVNSYYQEFLLRNAEPAGLAYWTRRWPPGSPTSRCWPQSSARPSRSPTGRKPLARIRRPIDQGFRGVGIACLGEGVKVKRLGTSASAVGVGESAVCHGRLACV